MPGFEKPWARRPVERRATPSEHRHAGRSTDASQGCVVPSFSRRCLIGVQWNRP